MDGRVTMLLRLCVLVPIAAVAAWAIVSMARNAMGYCAKKQAYITHAAMIEAGINELLARQNGPCVGSNAVWSCTREIKYANAEDFKANNPDCCNIGRGPEEPRPGIYDFVLRMQGEAAGLVSIAYLQRDKSPDGTVVTRKATQTFKVENCGRVRAPW